MKIGHKSFELNIKKLLKCHILQCSMCKSQAEKQTNKHKKKTASAVEAVFFCVSCANDYRRKPNLATIAR